VAPISNGDGGSLAAGRDKRQEGVEERRCVCFYLKKGGSGGARGTTRHSEDVGGLAPTSDGRSLMSEPTGTVLGGAV
jgi:hypothetical protein